MLLVFCCYWDTRNTHTHTHENGGWAQQQHQQQLPLRQQLPWNSELLFMLQRAQASWHLGAGSRAQQAAETAAKNDHLKIGRGSGRGLKVLGLLTLLLLPASVAPICTTKPRAATRRTNLGLRMGNVWTLVIHYTQLASPFRLGPQIHSNLHCGILTR